MAAQVCAHCGELYAEGKLACPHCGADADLTWSEAPIEAEYATHESEDEDYREFLEKEGLAPKKRGGCLLCAIPFLTGMALLLL